MQKSLHSARAEKTRSLWFVWIVLAPILIQYTLTTIVPMVMSFVLTFFDWNLIGFLPPKFIGFSNWREMLTDPDVMNCLLVSVKYTLLNVVPTILIGLAMALAVNAPRRGTGALKAMYFFPVVTSTVVVASIWKWFFTAEATGVVNSLLGLLGISPVFWFGKDMALVTASSLGVFQSAGMAMVYYYAGLKGISGELYEAARIDGCTAPGLLWHITVPLLRPMTAYVLIITTSNALKVFDSIYVLYNQSGGPMNAAESVVMKVWRTSFYTMRMGYGSTIAYMLFFIILAISLVQYFGIGSADYE